MISPSPSPSPPSGVQVATYCLAMVDFGMVSPGACFQALEGSKSLSRHSCTRGLGPRLGPMLVRREAALAGQAGEPTFSFTPLELLSVVWPTYLQGLAASREPLTKS